MSRFPTAVEKSKKDCDESIVSRMLVFFCLVNGYTVNLLKVAARETAPAVSFTSGLDLSATPRVVNSGEFSHVGETPVASSMPNASLQLFFDTSSVESIEAMNSVSLISTTRKARASMRYPSMRRFW